MKKVDGDDQCLIVVVGRWITFPTVQASTSHVLSKLKDCCSGEIPCSRSVQAFLGSLSVSVRPALRMPRKRVTLVSSANPRGPGGLIYLQKTYLQEKRQFDIAFSLGELSVL